MLKRSSFIASLLQELDMAEFGLHLTSISRVLDLLTEIPQKSSQQIFYHSWLNQNTHMAKCLRLRTGSSISMISTH